MAPEATEFIEVTQNNAILPFKVTTFGIPIESICDFLCVKSSNLSYLLPFPRYRGLLVKLFAVFRGAYPFIAVVRGEPLNSRLRNLASGTIGLPTVLSYMAQSIFRYPDPFIGVTHECDGQTDILVANAVPELRGQK